MYTVKEANDVIGKLTTTTKMPCKSYNLPAMECKVGSALRKVKGSTCFGCYAMRGNYNWPAVKNAMYRRLKSIRDEKWVSAITFLINNDYEKKSIDVFRWHDSGDLQDWEHLLKIIEVCNNTPNVKHWLPTREYGLISKLIKSDVVIPSNLVIRLSATMINGKITSVLSEEIMYSTVHTSDKTNVEGYVCPAPTQDNECKDCRACWDKNIKIVSYKKH